MQVCVLFHIYYNSCHPRLKDNVVLTFREKVSFVVSGESPRMNFLLPSIVYQSPKLFRLSWIYTILYLFFQKIDLCFFSLSLCPLSNKNLLKSETR